MELNIESEFVNLTWKVIKTSSFPYQL